MVSINRLPLKNEKPRGSTFLSFRSWLGISAIFFHFEKPVLAQNEIFTICFIMSQFTPEVFPCSTRVQPVQLGFTYIKAIGGGVQGRIIDFLGFNLMLKPAYLLFRMGWLSSQFCTVAEIWRDEVGPYARVFAKMYGKIPKNWDWFLTANRFLSHWVVRWV